jgi:hypothetical protein
VGAHGFDAPPALSQPAAAKKTAPARPGYRPETPAQMIDDDDIRHLDPDYDDVPEDLAEHEGRRVLLWVDGQPPLEGTLVVAPGAWAHARRFEEDPPPLGPAMN